MPLLPAYYTSTNLKRRKKKTSKVDSDHDKWLKQQGLHPSQLREKKLKRGVDEKWKTEYSQKLKVDRSDYVSAGLSGDASSCAKRGVMVNLHKEPKHVQEAILEKASRVMPLYNKGGLQLLSPNDDLTKVGSLSRRG